MISKKAKIGRDVEIMGNSTFIGDDVIIGDNCWIGPNVTIFDGARIGNNCKIFPGAVISAIPQDLKFEGEKTTVEIGDYVTIRECVTINRGTKYSFTTKVGNHCLIMAYVHIAHDCVLGDHCILSNFTQLAGHVIVDEHVVFGGMSAAHQFTHIGKHAFIGGATLLRKDVPPYVVAARRDPAVYSGINSVGLKRRGFTIEQIHLIQDVYRHVYANGYNTTQALEKLSSELEITGFVKEIVDFIQNSGKGIIKGLNQ